MGKKKKLKKRVKMLEKLIRSQFEYSQETYASGKYVNFVAGQLSKRIKSLEESVNSEKLEGKFD